MEDVVDKMRGDVDMDISIGFQVCDSGLATYAI